MKLAEHARKLSQRPCKADLSLGKNRGAIIAIIGRHESSVHHIRYPVGVIDLSANFTFMGHKLNRV